MRQLGTTTTKHGSMISHEDEWRDAKGTRKDEDTDEMDGNRPS